MSSFSNAAGARLVPDVIATIQANKAWLSELDGAVGDGDHGINMSKGFGMCAQRLDGKQMNMTQSLHVLSDVLMTEIGGSMGPLYGMFFMSMATASEGSDAVDARVFGGMLAAAEESVMAIGSAQLGDKTMLDCLIPAAEAYNRKLEEGAGFAEALESLKAAALVARDATKDMMARVGRASRLGERSRGYIDPGAASCCLILTTMADSACALLATPE